MVRGRSARFTLGVALIGAPFVLLAGSLALLALATRGGVPAGLALPLLAAGLVLEVALGTAGVFLVLTSPELRPWSADRLPEP